MFRFPDSDSVTVQAEASSSRCAVLSVQNVSVCTSVTVLGEMCISK